MQEQWHENTTDSGSGRCRAPPWYPCHRNGTPAHHHCLNNQRDAHRCTAGEMLRLGMRVVNEGVGWCGSGNKNYTMVNGW